MYLLSGVFLDNDELNADQKFFSNQNKTDKINLISENMTTFTDFTGSMISHTGKSGALVQMYFRNDLGCAYWSRCAK